MIISEALRKKIRSQFAEFTLNDEELDYVAQIIAVNSALYNSLVKGKRGQKLPSVYPALIVNQVKLLVGTTVAFAEVKQ